VLSSLFRRLFLDQLRTAFDAGELGFFGQLSGLADQRAFTRHLSQLRRVNSCVEPRLDAIIFHSAQTAGEGRNVVLFHHAAGVDRYELPAGTEVDVDMGWTSEEDYDDSITVWEKVPGPKPSEEKKRSAEDNIGFDAILELGLSREEPSRAWEDDVFYVEPTLRLDVQKIEVFRIRAVSYQKVERTVSRYRRHADDKLPF
jgi:hypothetical protein